MNNPVRNHHFWPLVGGVHVRFGDSFGRGIDVRFRVPYAVTFGGSQIKDPLSRIVITSPNISWDYLRMKEMYPDLKIV